MVQTCWKKMAKRSIDDIDLENGTLTFEAKDVDKICVKRHTKDIEDSINCLLGELYGDDYKVTNIGFDETDDGATVAIVFKKK